MYVYTCIRVYIYIYMYRHSGFLSPGCSWLTDIDQAPLLWTDVKLRGKKKKEKRIYIYIYIGARRAEGGLG